VSLMYLTLYNPAPTENGGRARAAVLDIGHIEP
jgi:hypothetical protein